MKCVVYDIQGNYPNENFSLPEQWDSGKAILPTITDWSSPGKRRAQVKVTQGSPEYCTEHCHYHVTVCYKDTAYCKAVYRCFSLGGYYRY